MSATDDYSQAASQIQVNYEFEELPASEGVKAVKERCLQRHFGAGSFIGSVFTTLACTVGIGILSLPYAVNLAGLLLGDIIVVVGMLASFYTCRLLFQCAEKVKKPTYEEVGVAAFGKGMGTFVNLNMIINNYGTLIAYMVLIQQLIPDALLGLGVSSPTATSGLLWGGAITVCVVFPLSLLKEVSAFRYSSVISFIASVVICLVIVLEFFVKRDSDLGVNVRNAEVAKVVEM